jgi:uncharacterized protein YceH (UPF0502 family)
MAELLLRGQQTIGELRGRAARMEPIADLNELKPVLQSLAAKNLIVELTPPGRGQVVTHNLYFERELEKIRETVGEGAAIDSELGGDDGIRHDAGDRPPPVAMSPAPHAADRAALEHLQSQIEALGTRLDELSARLQALESLVR